MGSPVRVAQLLLGPCPGDPERRVEGDQRDGEQGQHHGSGDGDDTDQWSDSEQCDGEQALAQQGRTGDGRQAAALRGQRIPQEQPGHHQIGPGRQHDLRDGADPPVEGLPGLLDGRYVAEGEQDQRRRPDAEDVHGAVQGALAPAVPAGDADQDHDGEADEAGGHPAVQEQHREGEGGAGAGAAPPAVAAECDEMADDDAGEDRERPARGAVREERPAVPDLQEYAECQHEGGEAHHDEADSGGRASNSREGARA